jgi:glycosyltransferase involved in cell wall biosynthesis
MWLKRLVEKSILAEYPVAVINNGIDLNAFRPTSGLFRKSRGIDGRFMILGVASVWNERKGLKYFGELAESLLDDEVIVLVGLGERDIRRMPKKTIVVQRTENISQLAEIYSSADVFVNPTLEDNFPTTNLEALACGTPVVTFDTGGSPESVQDGCGIVVAKGDSQKLLNAIRSTRGAKATAGIAMCRQLAVERFDRRKMVSAYIEFYRQCSEQGR